MNIFSTISVCLLMVVTSGFAQVNTIVEKTAGMEAHEGFFTYYWDELEGKIWIEIKEFEKEFLVVNSLPAGLGSNDIGLDRGKLGSSKIVKFQRIGPKVLLVQPNYNYRALSDKASERKAVEDAFAQSVIWGFKVEAEEGGSVLIDATPFLIRDGHGVISTLRRSNQGTYKLDTSRSALYLPRTKNFPLNTEFEVILTFTSENGGNIVRSVTPDASAVTIRQHYSFVQLPGSGFEVRDYDPRSGVSGGRYMDFATPIDQPILKRIARRHRLKKRNPSAARSEAVEPIVYYVDSGTPEPIRSALIEGASWWNQAFEAAGYINAFQVRVLPEDADPMDLRYNVINWVHRSTRGWSYGSSVTDPRTGEIIKGHVSLGSLRVRQDFLIAEGLLSPYGDGERIPPEMEEMALARVRQLSAHEVGHTLGLGHNYIASVNNRASVMDYPHPLIKIDDNGDFDLSDAYDTGIGDWDKIAITWGYQDFPDGTDKKTELNKILTDAMQVGNIFITDQDARSQGSAHPYTHLWDNGADAVQELERTMDIRQKALDNFSENNIRPGAPMSTLEDVLVPIYLLHRYQIEAAAKVLGGANYFYALRGDGQETIAIVPAAKQYEALDMLLKTIDPAVLALDERILNLIPPRPPSYGQTPELFSGRTGSTFDPFTAAETAANMTITMILNSQRAARLIEYNARDNSNPGLGEVIDRLINTTWKSGYGSDYYAAIQRVIETTVLHRLMNLAANRQASTQTRATTSLKIEDLKNWLDSQMSAVLEEKQKSHYFYSISEIDKFQKNPDSYTTSSSIAAPAGSPIGMSGLSMFDYGCSFELFMKNF